MLFRSLPRTRHRTWLNRKPGGKKAPASTVCHATAYPNRPSWIRIRCGDFTGAQHHGASPAASLSSRSISSALHWILSSTTSLTHPPGAMYPTGMEKAKYPNSKAAPRGRLCSADRESPLRQLLLGTVSGSWDGTGLSNWVWLRGTLLPKTLVKPNSN